MAGKRSEPGTPHAARSRATSKPPANAPHRRNGQAAQGGVRRKRPEPAVPTGEGTASDGALGLEAIKAEGGITLDYLQSIIDENFMAYQEVSASNEELQSTNEELETAKEELTTVNEELQNRNVELSQVNDDLSNLLSGVNIPIVMLGNDLRIRRFTPPAEKLFNLIATDVGRPISDIKSNLNIPDLERWIVEVIDTISSKEQEVQDREGRWYSMRIRPYKTAENKLDGVVMVWVEVDALKRSVEQLRAAREYAEAIVETVREPLLVLDGELRVQRANQAFYQSFQVTPQETERRALAGLGMGQWDLPRLRRLLEEVFAKNTPLQDLEVTQEFPRIGRRTMLLNARCIRQEASQPQLLLLAIEDITERKQAEGQLLSSHQQLRHLSAHLESVREEERTRISHEIHDELGQQLTALKLDLSWMGSRLSAEGPSRHQRGVSQAKHPCAGASARRRPTRTANQDSLLQKTQSLLGLVDTMIQTVRKISRELRPSMLDDLGLVAAIQWQMQEFQACTGIRCKLHMASETIAVEGYQATAIFRILQEALTNITRHANATKVSVRLQEEVSSLILDIRDNGQGITAEEIVGMKSLGLLGMQERAHALGGEVKIHGKPGRGTTVTLRVPMAESVSHVGLDNASGRAPTS